MSQGILAAENLFNKLADETVEQIVRYVAENNWRSDSDILRISLCDRRLRRISLPVLFREVSFLSPTSIYRFFRNLVNVPEHGLLVRRIKLGFYPDSLNQHKNSVTRAEVRKFVEETRLLNLHASLVPKIKRKVPWAFALTFLPRLINLEDLCIDHWPSDREFSIEFAKILESHFHGSKLRSVYLFPSSASNGPDVQVLATLFSLPSITKVSASHVGSRSGLSPGGGDASRYNESNVEALRLQDFTLSMDILTELISLPRVLKKFLCVDGHGITSITSIEQLRQTIGQRSKTLEVLSLELRDRVGESNSAWSFYRFSYLKLLSISHWLLCTSEPEGIIDRLAPSLETLILQGLADYPHENTVTLDSIRVVLMEISPTVLTHLTTISSNGRRAGLSSLKDLALAKGVKLSEDSYSIDFTSPI
jgi:hypothetical protein